MHIGFGLVGIHILIIKLAIVKSSVKQVAQRSIRALQQKLDYRRVSLFRQPRVDFFPKKSNDSILLITDSDFNSRHAFKPGRQPSFCQHTTRLSVRSSRVMAQSGRLVLRSGQLTCPETLRTRLRRQGMRELGRLWAIGESPRPDRRVRVAKMWLGASKTATDDHL